MSLAPTHSPIGIFMQWLRERPDQARLAVAVDGDRLLSDAGVLGKETVIDSQGRVWQLVVFRGDDLAFRIAYRKARIGQRVLIVLARSTDPQSKIDVSYLTDILCSNEGGPPLDLSVPAVFRRICPKINFPVAELRRFKDELLEGLGAVPKAVDKIVERWGRPDDWGRGQVAALVLLSRHPDWVLSNIWPDETDPAAAVAHGLQVLLSVPQDSPDLPVIRELIHDAVYPQVKESIASGSSSLLKMLLVIFLSGLLPKTSNCRTRPSSLPVFKCCPSIFQWNGWNRCPARLSLR